MAEQKEHTAGHSHEHVSHSKKFSNINFWMVATIVLAVLLIGTAVFSMAKGISADKASQALVDFAKSKGVELTVVSVSDKGSFYEIIGEIQGQTAPFYISKDGKYFTSSVVELSASTDSPDSTQTDPQPTDVPKSDKPKVELFVMSYCPYGTQMEKAILPVAGLLGDKIDFQVRWVSYIMHGQKETDENTVQYCIQKEQDTKYLAYLQCFLADGDTTRCQKNASINTAMLSACVKSADTEFQITKEMKESQSQFPKYNVDAADNAKYGVQGSPTLVINGVQASVGRSPAAILQVVCAAFNNAPSECSTQLPTAQASPGFGYSASASDSAAVQCVV